MVEEPAIVSKAPCKSCPYRQDVPSGVWAAEEYDKLLAYDGEMVEQLLKGGTALFYCHQNDGQLCAGWVGCHGAENLFAMRFHHRAVDGAVWSYESPVPLFTSGQEACDHGKHEIDEPGDLAMRTVARISRKRDQ